jgi:hypothetical protein
MPLSKRCALILIFALVAAGCGKKVTRDLPKPFPVHGKVTYGGKPAQGFRVSFHSLGEHQGPAFAPSAVTDANGEFRLQSYQPGDGAPAGEYAATFEWLQDVNKSDPVDGPRMVDRLQGKFNNPSASTFKATVLEGENELSPFDLK